MTPRMKSSKKWTAFPKEYSEQIEGVFRENFAAYMDEASLVIEGRIYPEEVLLRVGYKKDKELRQANFEISMNYSQADQDAVERIHNCVDAAASMMMEYLEKEGDVDFPYVWKEYPFQNKKIYLQFTTENSELEAEADRLLGLSGSAMVSEEEENEDALTRADETLDDDQDHGEDDEDDRGEEEESDDEDEDKSPRMFGGLPQKGSKKKKEEMH